MNSENQIEKNLFSFLGIDKEKDSLQKSFSESFLHNSFDGIAIYDNRFKIIAWNPVMEKITGVSENDTSGEDLFQVLFFFNSNRFRSLFRQVAEGENVSVQEIKHITSKTGKEIILSANIAPLKNSNREVIGGIINLRIVASAKPEREVTDKTSNYIPELTEFKLRAFLDHSLSGIYALKAVRDKQDNIIDFQFLFANKRAEEILGVYDRHLEGRSLLHEFPFVRGDFFNSYTDVVNTRTELVTELPYPFDGKERWFKVLAARLEDGLVVTFEDITEGRKSERKIAEYTEKLQQTQEELRSLNQELEKRVEQRTKELSESEQKFRVIASITSDVIWDWNLISDKVWWSEGYLNSFGYKPDEVEPGIESWYNRIHPEDRQSVIDSINEAKESKKISWNSEYRYQKADGIYAIIFDRGLVMRNEEGKPVRMLGSMVDLTELRNTEKAVRDQNKQLKALLEEFSFVTNFIPDIVWSTNAAGEVDYFNKRWYDYTGLTPEESLKSGWSNVLHPLDMDKTKVYWQASVDTGEPYQVEYRIKKQDGSFRWFLGRGYPLRSNTGKIIKWYGTCTDIDDQKVIREDLGMALDEMNKKNLELKRINEFLDTFVHAAAHDLKSPINQMILILELYRKVGNEGKKEKLMMELGNAVKRLDQTTKSLVELIKVQYNDQVEIKNIDLEAVIQTVKIELAKIIEESGATIITSFHDGHSINYVEPFMISIIRNLLSNAIKYRADNRAPIIDIRAVKYANTNILLTVADNGMGMDLEKYKDKLFKPFSRFTRKGEGTGIGLHLIKTIVEKNGGRIEVESEPENGTSFKVYLNEYQNVNMESF